MPDYDDLAKQGIYNLSGGESGIRVFAGTVADPFYIDFSARPSTSLQNFRQTGSVRRAC